MAGLKLEHIYKVYPNGTKAVSDFTMDIKDQEFIVFVGPSGCGKSTTLRMIAGLEEISAGELYIDDRIVNDVEPKDRDIAMVFQNYALYPHMTVYENMGFGLKLRHAPNEIIHEKVLWAANVLGLTEQLDRKPRAMSGGQRQRVALGRAILRNPKVMLLDEPLSNLDAKLRAAMRSEISKLHDQLKTTFIYVTHDQVEAMTLGTRVVVMKLGKIMQVDTPKNLYDYPENLFVAGFIGTPQMNMFDATLAKVGNNVEIHFNKSESVVKVPHAQLSRVQHQYLDGKTPIVVGLRCEDLSLDPEVVKNSTTLIDVRISHFEELGSETLIYADVDMSESQVLESHSIIIKGKSNYGLQKGQIVQAHLDMNKVHLFDKKTEMTINPRVPTNNLIASTVTGQEWNVSGLRFELPPAIALENGEYDAIIPSSALTLSKDEGVAVKVTKVERIGEVSVAHVQLDDRTLFVVTSEEIDAAGSYKLTVDYTQVSFLQEGQVKQAAISAYDKVDSIFLNHASVKQFVGDKYDKVIEQRVAAVNEKYQPLINSLTEEYNKNLTAAQAVNAAEVNAKNAPVIAEKKAAVKAQIAELVAHFQAASSEATKIHKENNKVIEREVAAAYDKIYNDEISAFEAFKQINKDRDAYTKRLEELRSFKATHKLERDNEINKKLNLEAIRYETEMNALKGNVKREKEALNKELQALVKACANEANPAKKLTKEYKEELRRLTKEYNEKLAYAKILFFFKTDDLITMSNDSISNKMIQGLGIKVFTKQYLIEIPHDAYYPNEYGLALTVKETLDYGVHKYLRCETEDEKVVYVEITDKIPAGQTTLKLGFEIENIHITEKAMDIKIY